MTFFFQDVHFSELQRQLETKWKTNTLDILDIFFEFKIDEKSNFL